MDWQAVDEFKETLRRSGFGVRAVLSDEEMSKLQRTLEAHSNTIAASSEELRFIEGLYNLPLGHLEYFKVIPKPGYEQCQCGRVPTALDIVHYTWRNKIHDRELVRDTLLGVVNVFEFAENGRKAECYRCGRTVVMAGYFKQGYAYA